jgi:hypothetical protein
MPDMYQRVVPTLRAVATPFAANVRLPVVPSGERTMVSEVIAMVTVLISFRNVIVVPMG